MIVWLPTASPAMVKVAWPLPSTATVPSVVAPSLKVTMPVGVAGPVELTVTGINVGKATGLLFEGTGLTVESVTPVPPSPPHPPKDGKKPEQSLGDGLAHVDWSRTYAYATGLGGIYLNFKDRERDGILEEGTEAKRVRSAIQTAMPKTSDVAASKQAVRSVLRREELYSGPYAANAPDLLVNFNPGYRVSWQSAVGGFSNSLIEDNLRRWSGDHIVDPEAMPGILFMNQNLHPLVENITRVGHSSGRLPNIIDLAPTILNYLEVPVPQGMEGKSLL